MLTYTSHSAQTVPRNTGREADLSMQRIKAAAAATQGSLAPMLSLAKPPGDEQPAGRGYANTDSRYMPTFAADDSRYTPTFSPWCADEETTRISRETGSAASAADQSMERIRMAAAAARERLEASMQGQGYG